VVCWSGRIVLSNIKIVREREIVPSLDDLVFLVVLYCIAYGLGSLISFFWVWLRIIALIIFCSAWSDVFGNFEVNFNVILVGIIPLCLVVYPSVKKTFLKNLRFSSPFGSVFEKMAEKRYSTKRAKEREMERETLEQAERILRMQAEEAERQRQFEREKAEREARERARTNDGRQENHKTKADTDKDP
jgi:signal transduction histidine kinase